MQSLATSRAAKYNMLKKHPSKNPLRGLIPFLTDAAINIASLRDWRGFWRNRKVLCRVRFGRKPNLPCLGLRRFFCKIDSYGAVRNAGRIWASTPQNRTYLSGIRDGYFLSSSAFVSLGVMFTMSCSVLMALQATRVFRIWCANVTCFVASSVSSAWKMHCFWYP